MVIDFLPEGVGTWQAIAALGTGGRAVLMGANTTMPPVPTLMIMVRCWNIVGTRNCTREDTRLVTRWLRDGVLRVDDLITHRFPLRDIASAQRIVQERQEPAWMVLVHP